MNKHQRHLYDLIYRSFDAATVAYYIFTLTDFFGEKFPSNFVSPLLPNAKAIYTNFWKMYSLTENKKFAPFGKLLMRYLQMTELGFGVIQIILLFTFLNFIAILFNLYLITFSIDKNLDIGKDLLSEWRLNLFAAC